MTVTCRRAPRPETAGDPLAFEVISRTWKPVPSEVLVGPTWQITSVIHFDRHRGPDGECTFEWTGLYTEALLRGAALSIVEILEAEDRVRVFRVAAGVVQ